MPDSKKIINAVAEEDSKTISKLLEELAVKASSSLRAQGLSESDIEEVLLDSITIFIEKVKNGQFVDRGIPVMAYLFKIANFRGQYYVRKNSKEPVKLVDQPEVPDGVEESDIGKWDLVLEALDKLPPSYKRIIQLTYIEGYSDREIIEENLSEYTTINSLKSQRYKAMKLLTEVVEVQVRTQ